jgi:hypothetical protein
VPFAVNRDLDQLASERERHFGSPCRLGRTRVEADVERRVPWPDQGLSPWQRSLRHLLPVDGKRAGATAPGGPALAAPLSNRRHVGELLKVQRRVNQFVW